MHDDPFAPPEALLARISRRLDTISSTMHRLASERDLLRQEATRLRLGVPVAEVLAVLDHRGAVPGMEAGPSAVEIASTHGDRRPDVAALMRALLARPHGLGDVTARPRAEAAGVCGG